MKKKKGRCRIIAISMLFVVLSLSWVIEVPYKVKAQDINILEKGGEEDGPLLLKEAEIETDAEEYKGNEVLVAFEETYIEEESNKEYLSSMEGVEVKDYFNGCALISVETEDRLEAVIDQLSQEEEILYLQPNYQYTVAGTPQNEPYFSKQWGLYNDGSFYVSNSAGKISWDKITAEPDMDINVKDAWDLLDGVDNREVVVASIDTGVDISHEDLADNIWRNPDEKANGKDSDENGYEDDIYGWNFYDNSNDLTQGSQGENDHGTHVAGIIAASNNGIGIAGVASNINIKLMPIKALGGASGLGSSLDILKGIKYAESNGAVICNMSFGIEKEDILLRNTMDNSNMLFVVAAGNGLKRTGGLGYDTDLKPNFPASSELDNIISVANLNFGGKLDETSCYGKVSVDIAAPGTYIYSTLPDNKYGYMTGTSMAAPMVTGAAAMLYACYDGISSLQVREILLSTARPIESIANKTATGGVLDIYGALMAEVDEDALKGTEPNITSKVQSVKDSYKKTLKVQVVDGENNLSRVYYAKGKKKKAYFTNGSGSQIGIANGVAEKNISVAASGYYTIFAEDTAGNTSLHTKYINIKTVKLNVAKKGLKKGKTYTLKGTLTPDLYSGSITYTSSNPDVASVGKNTGKITAKKSGKTTITAKTKNGKPAKCMITVTK